MQQTSQGVDIGPAVNVVASESLRGHVVQRSDRYPGDCQRCLPAADQPGYTEVDHINEVAQRDQDVRRLDVAVDEVVSVRGIQGLGDLTDEDTCPLRRDRTVLVEQRADIGAVHQAHVNEEPAIDLAEVMNGDDVRIPQPRSDVRFALESLQVLPVTRKASGRSLRATYRSRCVSYAL